MDNWGQFFFEGSVCAPLCFNLAFRQSQEGQLTARLWIRELPAAKSRVFVTRLQACLNSISRLCFSILVFSDKSNVLMIFARKLLSDSMIQWVLAAPVASVSPQSVPTYLIIYRKILERIVRDTTGVKIWQDIWLVKFSPRPEICRLFLFTSVFMSIFLCLSIHCVDISCRRIAAYGPMACPLCVCRLQSRGV